MYDNPSGQLHQRSITSAFNYNRTYSIVNSDLVWHGLALLAGHLTAVLLGLVLAPGLHHLPLLGLAHLPAGVVRVGAAGAGDGGPDLVVAGPLPLVLAVLLVVSAALRLGVVLHLVPAVEIIIS